MKTISTTAIVAMMITTIGLGAVAPAMAQQGGQQPPARHHMHNQGDGAHRQFNQDGPRHNAPRAGGMLGGLLDFSRGGENIEIALVRLSHRVDLTDEQKTLLETYKTAALTAQSEFAATLASLRPAPGAAPAERPNVADRLTARITLEKAHVDALTAVQPSFTALFDSLTDEQKAKLMPQRQQRMGWGHHRNGNGNGMHAPQAPAALDAPAMAPETPPAN
jgi:hypothetical protein